MLEVRHFFADKTKHMLFSVEVQALENGALNDNVTLH